MTQFGSETRLVKYITLSSAVVLGAAISIDFDYFSRHSSSRSLQVAHVTTVTVQTHTLFLATPVFLGEWVACSVALEEMGETEEATPMAGILHLQTHHPHQIYPATVKAADTGAAVTHHRRTGNSVKNWIRTTGDVL